MSNISVLMQLKSEEVLDHLDRIYAEINRERHVQVINKQATIYAAVEDLDPQEIVQPIAEQLERLNVGEQEHADLRMAKAYLAGFIIHADKFLFAMASLSNQDD